MVAERYVSLIATAGGRGAPVARDLSNKILLTLALADLVLVISLNKT